MVLCVHIYFFSEFVHAHCIWQSDMILYHLYNHIHKMPHCSCPMHKMPHCSCHRPWQVVLDDTRVFIDPDHRQAVWAMFDHLFSTVLCLNARRKLALQKATRAADAGTPLPQRPATAEPRTDRGPEVLPPGGTPPLARGAGVRHRRVQSDILPARSDRIIRAEGASVAGCALGSICVVGVAVGCGVV